MTAVLSPVALAGIRACSVFADLGEQETLCLEDAVEREVPQGTFLAREGAHEPEFAVLVEGEVRILRRYGDQEVLLATIGPGGFFGEILLLLDLPSAADVVAVKPTRLVIFDRPAFFKLLRTCEPAATRILRALATRLRNSETFSAQREKLASLGTMAAGMAHELNNPIAAARRSISSLGAMIKRWRELSLEISRETAAAGCWKTLLEVERSTVERARTAPKLDPITLADREDELIAWMDAHGVEETWKLAPTFALSGLDLAWLESLGTEMPGEAVPCVLPWLEAGLSVDALLREADEATGRVSGLVKAIKSYSHVDRQPRQAADIHEGIETTLKILAHKLGGISVVKEFEAEIPPLVCYPGELNQVWTNLIANAAEVLRGVGSIRIRTHREDDSHVTVTVTDDGPGIPADAKGRIFEPFFTTKAVGEGTGLGLVISNRIVAERHGGEIEVESKPGETTFLVRLPLIAPAERKAQAGEAQAMA